MKVHGHCYGAMQMNTRRDHYTVQCAGTTIEQNDGRGSGTYVDEG